MTSTGNFTAVESALHARHSVRAYLDRPVSRTDLEAVLSAAARAPSGTNTQPWKVHVLQGDALQAFAQALRAAFLDPKLNAEHHEEYPYYPTQWVSPYIDRRRKVGWDLYGLLGIGKEDKARMQAQHAKNFEFFGAPVGMIFTIDRVMAQGSWLDYGMFLQSVMLAAQDRGLATCPQAAFTQFHRLIQSHLSIPDSQMVVCGMALGYEDTSAVENTLRTQRMPLEEFVDWRGSSGV